MKISGTIFIFLMGALMTASAQVDELISDLVDGGKVARREAARSLALIGPEAKAAVPALARALDDDEVQVFFWSATALANLGPAAHEATPELIKRLSRGGRRYRDQVRLRVVTALTRIGPAAVPQLIDALGDDSSSIRSGAAKVLGNMGPAAHEAVPRLFALLADEENHIGETAGAALGKIGPAAHPQVLEALGSEEENIRAAAAVAIGWMNQPGEPSGRLAKLLVAEQSPGVIANGLEALNRVGLSGDQMLPLLLPALEHDDEPVRHEAMNGLLSLRPDSRAAVPHLLTWLGAADPAKRSQAIDLLGRIGPDAGDAVPSLITHLGQAVGEEKAACFNAMVEIGQAAVPGILASVELLPLAKLDNSWQAQCLGDIGQQAALALAAALKKLNDEIAALPKNIEAAKKGQADADAALKATQSQVSAAKVVLAKAREAKAQAVAAKVKLSALLMELGSVAQAARRLAAEARATAEAAKGDNDLATQADVVAALAKRKADEFETALDRPALIKQQRVKADAELKAATQSLADAEAKLKPAQAELDGKAKRLAALETRQAGRPAYLALLGLKNIEAKSAVARQAILPYLEHEQAAFRGMALASLVASTAKPASLMPRLRSAMNDDNPIVRQSAMDALASLGPSARGATSALVERLGDKDGAIQLSAVRAIGKLGSADAALAGRLVGILDGAGTDLRLAVVESLGGFRKLPNSAVTSLVGVLNVKHAATQAAAFAALAKLGPVAKAALPALNRALDHDNAAVRASALFALARVDPDDNKLLVALKSALDDSSAKVRHTAIRELGELGSDARPAGPELFARLDVSEDRQVTMDALRRVRVRDVDLYISVLDNDEPLVRLFACQVLRRVGKGARKAEPELQKRLRDDYDYVRREARRALDSFK
jgi:HEAT repeat protein